MIEVLIVVVVGATLLVALDNILQTTFKGPAQRFVHVVAYALWGAAIYSAVH
jgi:hypothetical protein